MFAKYESPVCPYCGKPAKLLTGQKVYPQIPDLHKQRFWGCRPCDAYVGCHNPGAKVGKNAQGIDLYSDGTLPMGRLANASLRAAKQKVHRSFDRHWKSYAQWVKHPAFTPAAKHPSARRKVLYGWLASQMGLTLDECHIGLFTEEQCQKALDFCKALKGTDVELSMEEKLKELFEAEEEQDFNAWETSFMETMRRTCKNGDSVNAMSLSDKQRNIVENMYEKYCE